MTAATTQINVLHQCSGNRFVRQRQFRGSYFHETETTSPPQRLEPKREYAASLALFINKLCGLDEDNSAILPFFNATTRTSNACSPTRSCTIFSEPDQRDTLAYRRSEQNFPVRGDLVYPGLDQFPNIGLLDLGVDIGPNGNFPQSGIENNYQVVIM